VKVTIGLPPPLHPAPLLEVLPMTLSTGPAERRRLGVRTVIATATVVAPFTVTRLLVEGGDRYTMEEIVAGTSPVLARPIDAMIFSPRAFGTRLAIMLAAGAELRIVFRLKPRLRKLSAVSVIGLGARNK
jgi:hypothetical protein